MRAVLVLICLLAAGCTTSAPDAGAASPPISIAGDSTGDFAELVRAKTISDEEFEWEPSGALDPTDSDHYVVAYRSGTHLAFSVRATFDGGQSWKYSEFPLSGDDEWNHHGDPVVFFSPDGRLYLGGLAGFDTTPPPGADSIRRGRSIIVSESADGGLSWEPPVTVAQGSGTITTTGNVARSEDFVNHDRPWFAAGAAGVLIVAWNELGHDGQRTTVDGASTTPYDGNEFQYALSRDGGTGWTDPVTLSHGGWPGALVREDGSFVLAHGSHLNGKVSIFTSDDGVGWQQKTLGGGVDTAMLAEVDGDILVATATVHQGQKGASYYRVADAVTGPYIFGRGQEASPSTHIVADPNGGFWASWLHDNGTVNLAHWGNPDSPWPSERNIIARINTNLGAYGDYVYTLGVGERLYMVWNDLAGADRQLYVSVY